MKNKFRAPAVPLIAVDPFFSVWSYSDCLYDDVTYHWTNRRHYLGGTIRIDGKLYRFMGKMSLGERYQTEFEPMEQKSVEVLPLTTNYVFEAAGVRLGLSFMTPLLMDDLKLMSRPISYIDYTLTALDGKEHDVKLYFDVGAELAVNTFDQEVTLDRTEYSLTASMGNDLMLQHSGDDHRIEWGTLHLIAPDFETACYYRDGRSRNIHREGMEDQKFTTGNPLDYPGAHAREMRGERLNKEICDPITLGAKMMIWGNVPLLCADKEIKLQDSKQGFLCIGYDDEKSIQYFGENIEAYWKKDGESFKDIASKALSEHQDIKTRVDVFDRDLCDKAGALSEDYKNILCTAYRQAVAGHKCTYHGGEIQFFSKENYSNGCIGTVDVTYPSIPLFLLYNPDLVEGMLNPIFKLIEKGLWEFEFAPHDVGQYPLANKQIYGFKKKDTDALVKQMPVEECGNMIICVAALCAMRKDHSYFVKHFDVLKQWADYLLKVDYDPDHQLCTDDFAGHLAHNCNLSVKGIVALAMFAKMCEAVGNDGSFYRAKAEEFADKWVRFAEDGDHYRLAFDQPNTWSIKYNMVWDKLFGLDLFPKEVYQKELAYYKGKFNGYGLPLDNRADYTKSDWQMWSTVLFEDKEYFDKVCKEMVAFLSNTPDRIPFTDWYFTSKPLHRGFQARTVQGGLFINLLTKYINQ